MCFPWNNFRLEAFLLPIIKHALVYHQSTASLAIVKHYTQKIVIGPLKFRVISNRVFADSEFGELKLNLVLPFHRSQQLN